MVFCVAALINLLSTLNLIQPLCISNNLDKLYEIICKFMKYALEKSTVLLLLFTGSNLV